MYVCTVVICGVIKYPIFVLIICKYVRYSKLAWVNDSIIRIYLFEYVCMYVYIYVDIKYSI